MSTADDLLAKKRAAWNPPADEVECARLRAISGHVAPKTIRRPSTPYREGRWDAEIKALEQELPPLDPPAPKATTPKAVPQPASAMPGLVMAVGLAVVLIGMFRGCPAPTTPGAATITTPVATSTRKVAAQPTKPAKRGTAAMAAMEVR